MTAPVSPAGPTTPTTTPVVEAPNEGGWSDVAARIARKIPVDIQVAPAEQARDLPPDGVVADPHPPTDTVPASTEGAVVEGVSDTGTETPPQLVGEIVADEPEGELVLRARDPKTGEFSEMDQTRTYELSLRDKQTGETKVYNKTLPDLMRLAKDGIAMQKSRHELDYYRTNAPQWEAAHQQTQARSGELEALAVQLLTAPEEDVVSLREQYATEHTPEKELARVKRELDATRTAQASESQQRQTQAAIQTLSARIGPAVAEVEALLGKATAAGQLALATQPLYVNGRIPPQHFAQLESYVTGPYLAWARGEAARLGTAQREAATSTEAARKTQQRAQQVVNQAGQQIRPVGGVGADPAVKGPPKNANDAIDRIIARKGSATVAAGGM